MTPEQYWDGDCTLVKAYRRAGEYRTERANFEAWLQGMYFYEALCDVSPILHDFAKKGTKAHPFPTKPYELGATHKSEKRKVREEDTKHKDGFKKMEAIMIAHNAKHKNKEKPPTNGALQE